MDADLYENQINRLEARLSESKLELAALRAEVERLRTTVGIRNMQRKQAVEEIERLREALEEMDNLRELRRSESTGDLNTALRQGPSDAMKPHSPDVRLVTPDQLYTDKNPDIMPASHQPAVAQEKPREWPCEHIVRHKSGGWEIKDTDMMPCGDWCPICGATRPPAPADSGKEEK